MTAAFLSQPQELILAINGFTNRCSYGVKEKYPLQTESSDTELKKKVNYILQCRANCLGADHQIFSATVRTIDKKNYTLPCLSQPVDGKYGGVGFDPDPVTVTVGSGGGAMSIVLDEDSLQVNAPQDAAAFQMLFEGRRDNIRSFHGVPDLLINNFSGVGSGLTSAWFTASPTIDVNTPPDCVPNYYENFVEFFKALIVYSGILVKTTQAEADANGGATHKLLPYTDINYRFTTSRRVGRPFGQLAAKSY